jgi:hypothetical protein
MNDLKKEFEESATKAYQKARDLQTEAQQPGLSETQVFNKMEEAQKQFDIATTLDNCGRAIKP